MDISICMPGIRTHLWERLYDSIQPSVGSYSWELIIVGPFDPPDALLQKSNFKYFKDRGAPARCTQMGVEQCSGKLLMWGSDDGDFLPDAIAKAADLWHNSGNRKNIICIRYREGNNRGGNSQPLDYWRARHHDSLRVPGVTESDMLAPVGMLELAYFRELGGWDCRYEHLNMCCHDLAFRIQKDGGQVLLSPDDVINCDWTPTSAEYTPVYDAFLHNDLPLFQRQYSAYDPSRVKIDLNNWRSSPEVWRRFA